MPKFINYIILFSLGCVWLFGTVFFVDANAEISFGKLAQLVDSINSIKLTPSAYPAPTSPAGGFGNGAPGPVSPRLLAQVVIGGPTAALTVSVSGPGIVTTTGINCLEGSGDCTDTYSANEVVSLKAALTGGSQSVAWLGCSVNPTDYLSCYAVMDQDKTVTVKFLAVTAPLPQLTLNLTKAGVDTDFVSGTDGSLEGISCGSGCSALTKVYDKDTTVTLTATPGPAGSTFTGWTLTGGTAGDSCSGSIGDCVIKFTCPTP